MRRVDERCGANDTLQISGATMWCSWRGAGRVAVLVQRLQSFRMEVERSAVDGDVQQLAAVSLQMSRQFDVCSVQRYW